MVTRIMKESTNRKQVFQLITMILLTSCSQIVALYKSRFTAVTFGATDYMDAYNFSLGIASFVFSLVTGGITAIIIPAYVKKVSLRVVNTFITITYGSVILIALIILNFRIPFISFFTERGDNFVSIASTLLIISFIIQGITAFLAVTAAYYQCENRYNTPKFIVLLVNLFVLITLLFGGINNIHAYFFLLLIAALVNLILDIICAVTIGFRYTLCFDIKNKELMNMMKTFFPVLLASSVYQFQFVIWTTVATNLPEGQVTILNYSSQIINLVNAVIIGNLTTYVYPKIIAKLEDTCILSYFWDCFILFHAILMLIIAGFINVGLEFVSLLFLGGKFTQDNVNILYFCACVFIFSQQFYILIDLIYKYFYAHSNTKDTFRNSITASSLNIILTLFLVKFWGIYGIVLVSSLTGFFSLSTILLIFKKRFGLGIRFHFIILELGKNLFSMIGTVLIIQWMKSIYIIADTIISILVYGILSILVYVMLSLLLRTRIKQIRL